MWILARRSLGGASKPRDPEDSLYLAAKESSKAAGFTVSSRSKGSEDYFVRVPVKLAKGQPLQATVLLLVDRLPETGSWALVTVDSIDITVKADSAPKKKSEKSADTETSEKKTTETSDKKESSEKKDSPAKKESTKSEDGEKSSSKKNTEHSACNQKNHTHLRSPTFAGCRASVFAGIRAPATEEEQEKGRTPSQTACVLHPLSR